MVSRKIKKLVGLIVVTCAFVFLSNSFVLASIQFDAEAIEADIAAEVANGADPAVAARSVVDNAIKVIVAANQDYPGGQEALYAAILEALENLQITGLDETDLFISGIEAYEPPGAQGRANARNRGGNAYGPGGRPDPGSNI